MDFIIFYYGKTDDVKRLHLPNNQQIHIWLINYKDVLTCNNKSHFYKNLTSQEILKAEKYRKEDDRSVSMISRFILKQLLAAYLSEDIRNIRITTYKNGKPFLEYDSPLHFNISHSGDYIIMAFSMNYELGIDIEHKKELPGFKSLAAVFSKEEKDQIIRLGGQDLFYEYWTCKEAYVKGTGAGLRKEFNSFTVKGDSVVDKAEKKQGWKIKRLSIVQGYATAVAYRIDLE